MRRLLPSRPTGVLELRRLRLRRSAVLSQCSCLLHRCCAVLLMRCFWPPLQPGHLQPQSIGSFLQTGQLLPHSRKLPLQGGCLPLCAFELPLQALRLKLECLSLLAQLSVVCLQRLTLADGKRSFCLQVL